jgi:type IV pilus assembly protein PilE
MKTRVENSRIHNRESVAEKQLAGKSVLADDTSSQCRCSNILTGRNMTIRLTRGAGFTLIELLIALVIISLLAMVAYPSYQKSVLRTRRADGIAGALAVQVAEEKFRASCPYYAQSLGSSNTCGANAGASTVQASATSPEGYYTLSIVASSATGNAYTINAAPTGIQADDTDCSPMQITFDASHPNGDKTPEGCW